jgi:hypothetical protein
VGNQRTDTSDRPTFQSPKRVPRRERHSAAPADLRDSGDARGVAAALIAQAVRANAVLVLRERRTDPYARRWRRQAHRHATGAWQIDPPAFAAYRHRRADVVLTRAGTQRMRRRLFLAITTSKSPAT